MKDDILNKYPGLPDLPAFRLMAEEQAFVDILRKMRPPVINTGIELDYHCPCKCEREKQEFMMAYSRWATDGGYTDD